MPLEDAVIIDAVRSPMAKGKPGGALSEVHAVELLAQVLWALMDRSNLDPSLVDDVLIGCVSQAADQSGTPGRWAWLAADLPEHVPSVTIDRRCGSSQQALHFAAHGVIAGEYDVVVAGGVESMSRVPMGANVVQGPGVPFPPEVTELYDMVPQGISAELMARKYEISRRQMDEFSVQSHLRAARATEEGRFEKEIIPVTIETEGGKEELRELVPNWAWVSANCCWSWRSCSCCWRARARSSAT